jgi:hypothetical protein
MSLTGGVGISQEISVGEVLCEGIGLIVGVGEGE